MLLDRLDQLPLRRHEIRGNPAGLLARLLARIDALKAERVGPDDALRARAGRERRRPADEAEREAARRELEFAELYTAHDRILAEPAASTAATSSSPSTACWSSAPTCGGRSPSASST